MIETKICTKCKIEKNTDDFSASELKRRSGMCKSCIRENFKKWARENPEKAKAAASNRNWAQENPEKLAAGRRKWRAKNSEKRAVYNKRWKKENPEKVNASRRKTLKKRYENNPVYRNRVIASIMVDAMLKSQGSSKNGRSSLSYFPWTPEQLWAHLLEEMNKPGNEWMTPYNQGRYDTKTRKEDDKSTWTWQLDHIIPQSDLPYDSMEHPNFKKAWALSNLRPLDSKQNVMDGVNKTRHKKQGDNQ
jgi:hypothetical protein